MIILGMLCEGRKNNQPVTGIVAAIHSTGRLTLLRPDNVREDDIAWQRVVASPQQHLRVLSTDRVVFMPWNRPLSDTDGAA
jgi:hypothetical protein